MLSQRTNEITWERPLKGQSRGPPNITRQQSFRPTRSSIESPCIYRHNHSNCVCETLGVRCIIRWCFFLCFLIFYSLFYYLFFRFLQGVLPFFLFAFVLLHWLFRVGQLLFRPRDCFYLFSFFLVYFFVCVCVVVVAVGLFPLFPPFLVFGWKLWLVSRNRSCPARPRRGSCRSSVEQVDLKSKPR